jgi:hypothetical protein
MTNDAECIWVGDSVGGKTTFNFSACTGTVTINLNAGSFSSTGITPQGQSFPTNTGSVASYAGTPYDNISISYGTTISVGIANNNAATLIADSTIGHNDVLVGGTGNDSFTACGGQDIFIGGGGTDSAIFHDASTSYTITNPSSGTIVVTDTAASPTDGTTVLDGDFTSLQFVDKTIAEASSLTSPTTVSAPAAIVQANLDALQTLVTSGRVTSIVFSTVAVAPRRSGDFYDNGYSDLLWQNTDGQAAIWEINGTSVIGGGLVGANPGPSWQVISTGDFYDNGYSDILWQNTDGQAAIWEMNGTSVIGGGLVGPNPGPSWQVIGTGDFYGNGYSDILWQNTSGQAAIWEMNGTNVIGGGLVGANPGPSWQAIGTGDFYGNGHSDILWQNTNGQAVVWEMDGTSVIGGGPVGSNPGPSWHLYAG